MCVVESYMPAVHLPCAFGACGWPRVPCHSRASNHAVIITSRHSIAAKKCNFYCCVSVIRLDKCSAKRTQVSDNMAPLSNWFPWTPRRAAKVFVAITLIPTCICGPAGRWAWPQAWVVALLPLLLFLLPTALYINKNNPDLFDEREAFIHNKGTAGFDKILAPLVVSLSIPMYLAAGLQHRYYLEGLIPVPPVLSVAALAVDVLAISWQHWAIRANRWFSSVVRLQTNRGHKVCSTGPYAYVRHPAYVGVFFEHVAEAVLLHSSWYLGFGLLRAAVFAVRTVAEDAWLHKNLPGYAAYAAAVRYRWLPYVW